VSGAGSYVEAGRDFGERYNNNSASHQYAESDGRYREN